MPTYNRRAFVPHAIRYFLRQNYLNKELIIIDDGTDKIEDLVPDAQNIRYYKIDTKITLGAKLNLACSYASGNVIANWDDDDWYAPLRLQYQVDTLKTSKTDVCGLNKLYYYDVRSKLAHQYVYPADQRIWLLGSSLCYTKQLWENHHFADINVGMDGLFIWSVSPDCITVLADSAIAVHMIHENNVSPKKTEGLWWHPHPVEEIQKIMQSDWEYYNNGKAANYSIKGYDVKQSWLPKQSQQIHNIYACLVHENEDCIIDLVRNLHYHDVNSTILLYNGSENPNLINRDFPYEKFGAVIHPKPAAVKHGYLHTYALDCMQFVLDNFSFDTLTIVDSDQLCIRSEYSKYIGNSISGNNIGMLSSMAARVTPDNTDDAVWPAVQAFREYDLWKPFLQKFVDGESKFTHWTFWPSSVFATDAIRDLIKIFKEDKLLQQIMKQSKIWATEEVILPTLIKLMGYDIIQNPCSYEYVRYRKYFNLHDLNNALHTANTYWMHPIERKYEHELRKYLRQRFNHYIANTDKKTYINSNSDMLTTFSLINKIKNIEGWLSDPEADLLMSITLKACKETQASKNIVEIGSYHGKSTVLLGSVIKEYFPEAKVYAIDPHEGTVGALDQGIHSTAPTLEMFNKNIADAGLSRAVELIKDYSYNVVWEKSICLLFIDGLHDYPNVSRDFWHFSKWVNTSGYIAFHDYSDFYPGVQTLVDELLINGNYRKINTADSLTVLQKL
jgi:glycosyltransferase involved in cell wall biosynthesis